jgi:hypothetical protein
MEEEAVGLAARLAEIGSTLSIGQLVELTERFAEVQEGLREAQNTWLQHERNRVRASLD